MCSFYSLALQDCHWYLISPFPSCTDSRWEPQRHKYILSLHLYIFSGVKKVWKLTPGCPFSDLLADMDTSVPSSIIGCKRQWLCQEHCWCQVSWHLIFSDIWWCQPSSLGHVSGLNLSSKQTPCVLVIFLSLGH